MTLANILEYLAEYLYVRSLKYVKLLLVQKLLSFRPNSLTPNISNVYLVWGLHVEIYGFMRTGLGDI
jgi:hypothetical protein